MPSYVPPVVAPESIAITKGRLIGDPLEELELVLEEELLDELELDEELLDEELLLDEEELDDEELEELAEELELEPPVFPPQAPRATTSTTGTPQRVIGAERSSFIGFTACCYCGCNPQNIPFRREISVPRFILSIFG
jgi:hypothetical protein